MVVILIKEMEFAINKLETSQIIDMINGLLAILDSRGVKIKKDGKLLSRLYIDTDDCYILFTDNQNQCN